MSTSALPMYVVEAFTIGNNQPFTGNTAGVCLLDFDDIIADDQKQKIAFQMNLAETAFITQGWVNSEPLNSLSSNRWTLRWFTPTKEVELCGHATLAAANIICHEILKKEQQQQQHGENETTIIFESKYKGELEATMNWSPGLITLNFPSSPTVPFSLILGTDSEIWLNQMIVEVLGPNLSPDLVDDIALAPSIGYLLFKLKNTGDAEQNAQLLKQIQPNIKNLTLINTGRFKMDSVTVTIQGSNEQIEGKPQFFSRYFAPWAGIDEDPVTGSAHTMLTPYWLEELRKQGVHLKSETILGKQLYTRCGEIICSMRGKDRVNMTGQSRLSMRGEFYA